jgi:predicted exporter
MRGQVQASAARLGTVPVRERLATWADAWVRKRWVEQGREVALMAAVRDERRRELRAAWGRAGVALQRLPY